MARVLLVGIDPDEVDFNDPALPPGLDADAIRAGIRHSIDQLTAAGHEAAHLYIPADPAGLGPLSARLDGGPVDCITIGGGVRLPPHNLALFEAVLNVCTSAKAPPRIALVAGPHEAAAAVRRVLG